MGGCVGGLYTMYMLQNSVNKRKSSDDTHCIVASTRRAGVSVHWTIVAVADALHARRTMLANTEDS